MSTVIDPVQLGQEIRRVRRENQLRLMDLALASGVGVRFLSELERGRGSSRLELTFRVLRALGMTLTVEGPGGPAA